MTAAGVAVQRGPRYDPVRHVPPRVFLEPDVLAEARLTPGRASDELLVLGVRSGDMRAFEVLYGRYRHTLERYARSVLRHHAGLAEDLVQEVFERAHRALLRDEREIALSAWLHTLVRNRYLDELRRTRPAALELLDGLTPALDGDPQAIFERQEAIAELLAQVLALPVRQRTALVALVLEGASHEALAARLQITVGASKSLVARARDRLAHNI